MLRIQANTKPKNITLTTIHGNSHLLVPLCCSAHEKSHPTTRHQNGQWCAHPHFRPKGELDHGIAKAESWTVVKCLLLHWDPTIWSGEQRKSRHFNQYCSSHPNPSCDTDALLNTPRDMLSPLQDEWRVGLTVSRVVDMDGVSTVGSELAQCSLTATHALRQPAASACHT